MKIYALNISQSIPHSLFNTLSSIVSNERREKINKFIRKEDADRSLAGDILLRETLIENFQLQNKDILFNYNEYGKPYLIYDYPIFFNISHSGNWVVCAINDYEIGIDVQKIDNIDLDIAKSFFSKNEHTELMKKLPSKRKEYFYDLWTLKESYIKACGMGLSLDLKSFSIGIEENKFILETGTNFKNFFFKQYNIDKDYKLSVCTLKDSFPKEITFKNLYSLNILSSLT